MSTDKIVVGIDLGTTNTCVAIAKKKGTIMDYEVVENLLGFRTTPSMIGFNEDGEIMIGQIAKNQQATNPERTIYGAKRLIGHKRGDEDVEKLFSAAPFKIDFTDEDDPIIKIPAAKNDKAREYKPEQISAQVLGEVVRIVKNKTGKEPDECIITVPAYFNDLQRQSTKIAAEIAGIKCNKLVNEPTAAAIAFQDAVKFDNGTVLVFDFGGGTLDVSILNVEGNKFIVKAVAGNSSLGGEDIDVILVDEMITRFQRKNPGKDPRSNKRSMAILKQKCEEAKCQLANAVEARITIAAFFDGIDLDETIKRARFEFICDEIISQVTDPIEEALEEAGLTTDDINHIILVGGSSHIRAVSKAVSEYFDDKIKPLTTVNVSEAVAIGAAIICDKTIKGMVYDGLESEVTGRRVTGGHDDDDDDDGDDGDGDDEGIITMIDVQPTSIGIKNGLSGFQKFIYRNKPLPQSNQFTFTTTKANQKYAVIDVFQGEDEEIDPTTRSHNNLGKFRLTGLPRGPKGSIVITVTMSVDSDGLLKVSAECEGSAEGKKTLEINVKRALSSEEMREAIKEQIEINERKEANFQYNKLLSDFQSEISRVKAKGVDVKTFETTFKNLSENIPKTTEGLQKGIQNMKLLIDKIKKL